METGPGDDVYVVKETSTAGSGPLDDQSAAGRQNHNGILMLFHSIGHGIVADTKIDRPQKSWTCWQIQKQEL